MVSNDAYDDPSELLFILISLLNFGVILYDLLYNTGRSSNPSLRGDHRGRICSISSPHNLLKELYFDAKFKTGLVRPHNIEGRVN